MDRPEIGKFKRYLRGELNKLTKNLKTERKAIKNFIKVPSPSAFLKDRISSIKLIINNGWDVALRKLGIYKRTVNKSKTFNDIRKWKSQFMDLRFEIEDFRESYRQILILIQKNS